jgi:hypothetical protein
MSVLIAVPVFRISCKVSIDKGRGWSVVEELILWAITRQSKTIGELALEAKLPHQIIVACIARLMRFRLVEVALTESPFENVAWDRLRVAVTPHRADVDERAPRASGRV